MRLPHLLRKPAVPALAVAVVLAGAGTAAANDWVTVFEAEEVTPVGIDAEDLLALPDLRDHGDLEVHEAPAIRSVAGVAEAAEATGLDVPAVATLPRGVTGEPVVQVGGEGRATYVLDDGGAQVRLAAGPGVALVWPNRTGVPALVVGRAVAPTASASGELPAEVAALLRRATEDGTSLPLPVPSDRVTSSTAEVAGVPATVLATTDRTLAAVVWVDGGVVTVVAGTLGADEVLAVARGLR